MRIGTKRTMILEMNKKNRNIGSGITVIAVLAAMLILVPTALAQLQYPANSAYFVPENSAGTYCENNTIVQIRVNTSVPSSGGSVEIYFDPSGVNITAADFTKSRWGLSNNFTNYGDYVRIDSYNISGTAYSGDNLFVNITLHCTNATANCTSNLNFSNVSIRTLDDSSIIDSRTGIGTVHNGTFECTQQISQGIDLNITAIAAYHECTYGSSQYPWLNFSNVINVTVENIGTEDAGALNVCMYIDEESIGKRVVSGLAAGNATTVCFDWFPIGCDCTDGCSPETYTLKAIADCEGDIAESNETNNESTRQEIAYWNGYAADEPLEHFAHGTLRGGLLFTTGDSVYKRLCVGESVKGSYNITLPQGAEVVLARLNVYYTWTYPKRELPQLELKLKSKTRTYLLSADKKYDDRKCGQGYDLYWGNWVYDVTPYIQESGTYEITVKCDQTNGSVCPAGPGLLILYKDDRKPVIEYWLNEGADLLEVKDGYIYPGEAITNASFNGCIDGTVKSASLGIVNPWANTYEDGGELFFNNISLGKDVYCGGMKISPCNLSNNVVHMEVGKGPQVAISLSDVSTYLTSCDNYAGIGDIHDIGMMPSNAFLVVEYREIGVNKTVWDVESGTWAEKANAKRNDSLRFRCVIHNVEQDSLTNISAVDFLPDCFEYRGNATVDGTPREPDWIAGDQFGWNFTGSLAPAESITIEFDATVDCTGTNTLKTAAWSSEMKEWLSGEDSVNITVLEPLSNPFFIYGWVIRSDGSQVNNPAVAITNLKTDEVLVADTATNSNYYQVMTSSGNVSASDVLRFTASDETGNTTRFNHTVTQEEINSGGLFNFNISLEPEHKPAVFDTCKGTYPSIAGTHKGTLTPNHTIEVNTMYTYACAGTGGHSDYVELYNKTFYVNATRDGYTGDYHNISFKQQFSLHANHTYNYTIRTVSYPQVHHTAELSTAKGMIHCTEFVDANGKIYYDWIPAIRLCTVN